MKRSNQDDPGTYHLFYADAGDTPAPTTFFPGRRWPRRGTATVWRSKSLEAGRQLAPVGLAETYGVGPTPSDAVGAVLPLTDDHGMRLALVEARAAHAAVRALGRQRFRERQIRGLYGA